MSATRAPISAPAASASWHIGAVLCVAGMLLMGSGASRAAQQPTVSDQVEGIEAVYGNQPPEVVSRLRALEPAARAEGGDGLRRFLAAWGYAHGAMDQFTVADAATVELIELGERQGNAAAMSSALVLRATMLQLSGRHRAAYEWVLGAIPWAEKTSDEPLRYWVYMSAGDLALDTGNLTDGLRFFEAAGRAASRQLNPRREAQAHLALAPVRMALGELDLARADALKADELAQKSDSLPLRVAAKVIESLIETEAGNDEPRRKASAAAQQLSRQLESTGWSDGKAINPASGGPRWFSTQAQVLQQAANLHLSAKHFEAARSYAERALPLARREGEADALDRISISLGLAQIGLGQAQVGARLVELSLASLRQRDRKVLLLEQLNRYAELLEHVGDASGALRQARAALALEAELVRSDRLNTVLDLQRQSSFAQQQRALETLRHENEIQASQLARHHSEIGLSLALATAMALAAGLSVLLYRRGRKANRLLARHNEELAHVSLQDRVTGLPNRRAIERDVAALQATGFVGLGISVKRFGLIMGSLGHVLGDELLCQVAQRLGAVVNRVGGTLYRLDGLSFGAVLPKAVSADLGGVLEELKASMQPVFVVQRQELAVTLSIGAAECPRHGSNTADVARAIQFAMRSARALPGNSAVVYSDDLMHDQQAQLQIETRLSQALERGELELFYQPQFELARRRLTGFEALLRWRSAQGPVTPDRFIPVAEESGLIVPIGRWVLQQACQQARAWRDAGLGEVTMAVNISPRQFQHPDFIGMLKEVISTSGVDATCIELEITESAVMDEADATLQAMAALRELGVHLALDDFGTGHSSLGYLKRFPINRLKIDRSFVRDISTSREDAAIVRTVIQLSHSLGMTVVAEGVEEEAQADQLRQWGCDQIQGFLLGRPTPASQATILLQSARLQATPDLN